MLVYIASDVRSGTTLLDMLLGGHSQIVSVGELQFLKDHFRREGTGYSWDWVCTCGAQFECCKFWSAVDQATEVVSGHRIPAMETWVRRFGKSLSCLLLTDRQLSALSRFNPRIQGMIEVGSNCWSIIDSISSVSGKPVVVDSSKNAEQFRFLYFWRPESLRFIHLVRDGRAVVYSKMVRGEESSRRATRKWVSESLKILLTKALLPSSQTLVLKYEELCADPQGQVDRIVGFLGLQTEPVNFSKGDRHNVCGSPHRFAKEDTDIKLDDRWKTRMTRTDRLTFSFIGGWLNRILGYA